MKIDRECVIITIYIIVATMCERLLTVPAQKQKLSDAEIITIAICSALFFNSNHDKALDGCTMASIFRLCSAFPDTIAGYIV